MATKQHSHIYIASYAASSINSVHTNPQILMSITRKKVSKRSKDHLVLAPNPPPWSQKLEKSFASVLGSYNLDPDQEVYLLRIIRDHMPYRKLRHDPVLLDYRMSVLQSLKKYNIPLSKLLSKRPSVLLEEPLEVYGKVLNIMYLVGESRGGRVILALPSLLGWSPVRLDMQLQQLATLLRCTFDDVVYALGERPTIIMYKLSTLSIKINFLERCLRQDELLLNAFWKQSPATKARLLSASPKVLVRIAYLLNMGLLAEDREDMNNRVCQGPRQQQEDETGVSSSEQCDSFAVYRCTSLNNTIKQSAVAQEVQTEVYEYSHTSSSGSSSSSSSSSANSRHSGVNSSRINTFLSSGVRRQAGAQIVQDHHTYSNTQLAQQHSYVQQNSDDMNRDSEAQNSRVLPDSHDTATPHRAHSTELQHSQEPSTQERAWDRNVRIQGVKDKLDIQRSVQASNGLEEKVVTLLMAVKMTEQKFLESYPGFKEWYKPVAVQLVEDLKLWPSQQQQQQLKKQQNQTNV